MRTVTTTPFGARPVTACLMDHQRIGRAEAVISEIDKWAVLDALTRVGDSYGISDRTLGVLRVLLSFHPDRMLKDGQPMVVFASNAALCDRAHGMPESTLRRHIAALVKAGLILRHDSPNGKRYARRGQGGQITRAFGFDLRPLLVRAVEIQERAAEEIARETRIATLREDIALMLRDAVKLVQFALEQGLPCAALDDRARLAKRALRRKLDEEELTAVNFQLAELLDDIRAALSVDNPQESSAETVTESAEMSGCALQNERHYQRSEKEPYDKTPPPLHSVVEACPDVHPYLDRLRGWNDFVEAICRVAPMTGIDSRTWAEACRTMGPENAATTVAIIVQRIGSIAKPGAYLRTLTRKAEEGEYSPLPLLRAMVRTEVTGCAA
ncbi:plasmid replication protein RepC [Pseudooceanicola sp.]|uniref:plasmid replication protein RepC n=1 Tax=Pseudooceanicola sp. TaxID=1914328 RepID=UPI0035C70BAD